MKKLMFLIFTLIVFVIVVSLIMKAVDAQTPQHTNLKSHAAAYHNTNYGGNVTYGGARAAYAQPAIQSYRYSTPVYQSRFAATTEPVLVAWWGSGDKLLVAKRSALHRARTNTRGHSYIESNRRSGVAWALNAQTNAPPTCHWEQRHQGAYAAYRIGNQIYSTLILN